MEEFIDTLSNEELEALAVVTDEDILPALRVSNIPAALETEAKIVDRLIQRAPALEGPVTIYNSYKGPEAQLFRKGGKLVEGAFFTGSTQAPDGGEGNVVTLALKIPAGTHVLRVPGEGADGYVLPRRLSVTMHNATSGPISTTIDNSSLTASIIYNNYPGTFITEEFHGTHNQASHGGKGGGLLKTEGGPKRAKLKHSIWGAMKAVAFAGLIIYAGLSILQVGGQAVKVAKDSIENKNAESQVLKDASKKMSQIKDIGDIKEWS